MEYIGSFGQWILWAAQAYKQVPSVGSAKEYLTELGVPGPRSLTSVVVAALVTLFIAGAAVQAWTMAKWVLHVSRHVAVAAVGVGVFSTVLMVTNQVLEAAATSSTG